MVKHVAKFLMINFIEKHCFEIFVPFFCLLPKTFITCRKIRFELIGEAYLLYTATFNW